jgi:hypothetical protein
LKDAFACTDFGKKDLNVECRLNWLPHKSLLWLVIAKLASGGAQFQSPAGPRATRRLLIWHVTRHNSSGSSPASGEMGQSPADAATKSFQKRKIGSPIRSLSAGEPASNPFLCIFTYNVDQTNSGFNALSMSSPPNNRH